MAAGFLFTQPALAQEIAPPPSPPSPTPGVAPAVAPTATGAYGSNGTKEVGFAFSLGYPTASGAKFNFLFIPGFHYFVMDRLSVGATMRIGYITGDGGVTVFQFVPGAQYHFNVSGSTLFPYVGAGLGLDYQSTSWTVCVFDTCTDYSKSQWAFLLDLEGGVKFKLSPHAFAAVGIDIPVAFHTNNNAYLTNNIAYLDVLVQFIYSY
jgi:hypothetical protein